MFSREVTITSSASPKQIWALWSDVNSWSTWDPDVTKCTLKSGSFQKGAKAILQPKGGPKVNLDIIECVLEKRFTSQSYLPLTTLVIHHEIKQLKSGNSEITHRVEFNGLLAPFFYCVIGRGIVKGLPTALKNLSTLAQKI